MRHPQVDNYSMLLLKGAQKYIIEESWPTILHNAYLFSKDVATLFPLPHDLIEPVDRILDPTVASLGTKHVGVWYLPNLDEKETLKLLTGAKHVMSDDMRILKLSLTLGKPCISFDGGMKRRVFIVKGNDCHRMWAKNAGFTSGEVVYYEPACKYRDRRKLLRRIHTPQMKSYHPNKTL